MIGVPLTMGRDVIRGAPSAVADLRVSEEAARRAVEPVETLGTDMLRLCWRISVGGEALRPTGDFDAADTEYSARLACAFAT